VVDLSWSTRVTSLLDRSIGSHLRYQFFCGGDYGKLGTAETKSMIGGSTLRCAQGTAHLDATRATWYNPLVRN
jgi:hypothetical protein